VDVPAAGACLPRIAQHAPRYLAPAHIHEHACLYMRKRALQLRVCSPFVCTAEGTFQAVLVPGLLNVWA